MAITPSGINYADLVPDLVCTVDLTTGEWTGTAKPSGERGLHAKIYRDRPDVQAIVHTHSSAAAAAACARVEVSTAVGLVPCAPYALPGTGKLTKGSAKALGLGPGVLLANHGAVTVGADLDQAFARATALEVASADLVEQASGGRLGVRTDLAWDSAWCEEVELTDGTAGLISNAPFTKLWAAQGKPLPSLLDDLAQLVGLQVGCTKQFPAERPADDAILLSRWGALVTGPDAMALAMVIEKGARAVIGAHYLGGSRFIPVWEAHLMRLVYRQSYSKRAEQTAH